MAANNSPAAHNRQTFRDDGVLTLSQVIDPAEIAELRRSFWSEVEHTFAIREDDTESWFANPHNPAGGSRARRLSGMNPVMENLRASGALHNTQGAIQRELDALYGSDRWAPLDKWYSLVSFPGTESQSAIPHRSWHNDEPIVVGDHEPWSIFVFVFLDRVQRETGPTLAITGSHRRGELLAAESGVHSEREVQAFEHANRDVVSDPGSLRVLPVGTLLPTLVAADEWFGDLVAETPNVHRERRLIHEGTSYEGIMSKVVDLSADAGDIIMFDPRCLHTASANVSERVRQVLRLDFRRLNR